MSGQPHPKPEKRPRRKIRQTDPDAYRLARTMTDECAACHRRPSNVHHVVPRGSPYHGDDVVANLLLLCGTGSTRCHGAFHGNPYVDESGRRWTQEDVQREVGRTIATSRPDTVAYVTGKLGDGPGRDYLRRRYRLEEATA